MVDRTAPALPPTVQADLLSVSRARLYYRPRPPQPATVALYHRIGEIYAATPFYGSRWRTAVLRWEGVPVNRKRVQTHPCASAPGPRLSAPDPTYTPLCRCGHPLATMLDALSPLATIMLREHAAAGEGRGGGW